MFNKLHYDAKFIEMFPVQDLIDSTTDTGDKNIYVRDADRVSILISGVVAGTADQDHTIKVYKCDSAGANDTAIDFDISKMVVTTGVYGTWTECTAATGHVIGSATLTETTHTYLIELDSAQFIANDDYATGYDYVTLKITGTDDTATWTGNITAILYGLKYQATV